MGYTTSYGMVPVGTPKTTTLENTASEGAHLVDFAVVDEGFPSRDLLLEHAELALPLLAGLLLSILVLVRHVGIGGGCGRWGRVRLPSLRLAKGLVGCSKTTHRGQQTDDPHCRLLAKSK